MSTIETKMDSGFFENYYDSGNNKQLLDEAEHDIMNYQNRGLEVLIIHDTMRKPNSIIVLLYIF